MKIAHIRSGSGFYGAERVILELSAGMLKTGDEIEVIVFKHDETVNHFVEKTKKEIIKTTEMPCSGKIDLNLIRLLKEYIVNNRIDIVHSHDYKTDMYAFALSFLVKSTFIATCHNWASDGMAMMGYRVIDKIILRRFSKIIAVSKRLRNELLRSLIAPDKVVYIPNGISWIPVQRPREDRKHFKKELGLDENARIVVGIGRLANEKCFHNLISSFKLVVAYVPNAVLLIAGDGPQRKYLANIILQNNLQGKVLLLGQRDDIEDILSVSDLFVMSSLKEGLPLALLEAMSRKIPVVATMVGDIPEVIVDGENGILIKPEDISQMADAIISLLNNEQRCRMMGEKGYTTVLDKYTSDKMVAHYSAVYKKALFHR